MSERPSRVGTAGKVLSIGGWNLRRLFRDRQGLFFVLMFPMLLVLVLGVVFGGGFEPALGVTTPAGDPLAAEIVAALESNDEIEVHRYDSAEDLRDAVEHGRMEAGAVLPADYGDRLRDGDEVTVAFLAGPTGVGRQLQPIVSAAVGEQAIRLQAARFATDHGADYDTALAQATELHGTMPEVTVRASTVGENLYDDEDFGTFGMGASTQIVLFMFVVGMAGSVGLIQTRQLGVGRRMLSTPTPTWAVVAGEGLGRFSQVMFQGIYILFGTLVLFGVDWGDPLLALLVLFAFGLVATGAAMLAGAVFRNDAQAGSVGVFIGLGLAALGGSMVPLDVFPPTMRTVAHLTPHGWANDALAELIATDAGLVDVLPEVAALLGMAVAILAVASWRLRRALTT